MNHLVSLCLEVHLLCGYTHMRLCILVYYLQALGGGGGGG